MTRRQSTKAKLEDRDTELREKLATATRVWIAALKSFEEGHLSGKDLIGFVESLNQAEWILQRHIYDEVERGFPGTTLRDVLSNNDDPLESSATGIA